MKPSISMKTGLSGTPRTEKRVELWTPWGVLRLSRAEDAARAPRKPQPAAWAPPAAAPARERDFESRV